MAPLKRRELLAGAVPAAMLAGAGLAPSPLLAQERPGRRPAAGVVARLMAQAFQNGRYALPPLPYPYDALEPHIDARTMRLHHDRHHLSYVENLNRTLAALSRPPAGAAPDAQRLEGLQRDLTFNGGGHLLHTLFWATMGPGGGGEPSGALGEALARQFGSIDAFRNYFTRVATGVKGSGWAVLAYEPVGRQLAVFQVTNHDLGMIAGAHPLLPIDVWEHAYYLRYTNNRAEYVRAWWNVVNWRAVEEAYAAARAGAPPAGIEAGPVSR